MSHIQSILVPVDFSAASERALASARGLADAFGATIHLLHVFETPLAMGAFMECTRRRRMITSRVSPRGRVRSWKRCLRRRKGPAGGPWSPPGWGCRPMRSSQYPREHGAIDLIVIATSGRGRVARLMMGSVADAIVCSAPCPVLTVHPHDRDEATEGGRAA